jgi:lipoprotein-releasing system ATP-binding protein
MTALRIQNVVKAFPALSGPVPVLTNINLTMEPGDAMALTGPSGSGKSTLLHVLGALEKSDSGSIDLDGIDPSTLGSDALADYRNSKIGFVFQDHHLLPQCTVLENVLSPAWAKKRSHKDALALESRARDLLERVGLGSRLDHLPAALSGGERQRAAVARALLLKPRLVLADEPTGNLDRTSASAVARLLLDMIAAENAMLIVVTHSMEIAGLFPRRYRMEDGRLAPA